MNESIRRGKEAYQATPIPAELSAMVNAAVESSRRRRRLRGLARRWVTAAAGCCAAMLLVVNSSAAVAQAVYDVPVLGGLARLFTLREYHLKTEEQVIDVQLPALENTGNSQLEQRINQEIALKIQQVLEQAEQRARERKEAWLATGGGEEGFMPVIVDVNYELKSSAEETLSFLLYETETQAGAYTQILAYNIDLESGKELTLRDVLGADWKELANRTVREEIARRDGVDGNVFYNEEQFGLSFQSIADDQKFYLNEAGNPVLIFEKYEIAPGFMGIQEFEVPRPTEGQNGQ